MNKIETIKATKREGAATAANKRLRKEGYLPATVYGKGMETQSIVIKQEELRKTLKVAGKNAVYKLNVEGSGNYDVIVKELKKNALGDAYINIDFMKISLTDEIKQEVTLRILGKEQIEAKRYLLVQNLPSILIKALPQDIPDHIEIDASELEPGEHILLADVKLPEGVKLETDPETMVVSVHEQRVGEPETTEEVAEEAAESVPENGKEEEKSK
jgi:large subunit ribosomal protein L25